MDIYSISEKEQSGFLLALRALFEQQWGVIDPFEKELSGMRSPPAMVAVKDQELMGGLAFSLWPAPETNIMAIWINCLLVKPEFRNKGIATRLLLQAMQQQGKLLVLTEFPDLYTKIGWRTVANDKRGVILAVN